MFSGDDRQASAVDGIVTIGVVAIVLAALWVLYKSAVALGRIAFGF